MISKRRTRFVASGSTVVAALAVGGVLVVSNAASQQPTRKQLSHSQLLHVSPVQSPMPKVAAVFARHFAIFRRARSAAASVLPRGFVAVATNSGSHIGALRLNLAQAQYVSVSSSLSLWIIPGASGACIVSPSTNPPRHLSNGSTAPADTSYGANCARLSAVDSGGFTGSTDVDSSDQVLFGLVPNGFSAVILTNANGSKQSVPVVDNVWASGDTGATSIQSHNVAGATSSTSYGSSASSGP